MNKKNWGIWITRIQKPLKDDTLFKVYTSLKIIGIPLMTLGILASMLWIILSLNLVFFSANGFLQVSGLEETYYEHLSLILFSNLKWVLLSFMVMAVLGLYVSILILRPFKLIGEYCDQVSKGEKAEYNQDLFTDVRLLTSFCEYFFNCMENALKNSSFTPIDILKKYQKIHAPVFEKLFFIQFFLLILGASVAIGIGIYYLTVEIYMDLITLSIQALKSEPVGMYFLSEQKEIFLQIVSIVMVIYLIMNFFLCMHFHTLISGPAFAVFSTMRAFLKGNFDSRIHVIGSRYLRDYIIKINKYLDYVQKNVELHKNKE